MPIKRELQGLHLLPHILMVLHKHTIRVLIENLLMGLQVLGSKKRLKPIIMLPLLPQFIMMKQVRL